jgi:hypothetical protein
VAIDTEIMFSKLYHLHTAIDIHGDEPELIWRYFGPGTTVADWEYFAQHKDFQSHFAEKPMTEGQIKQARRMISNSRSSRDRISLFLFHRHRSREIYRMYSPSSLSKSAFSSRG